MKKAQGSVRMGPVSLVALIIVLCMAVMCVLSITTARAMYSSTERQASSTVEVYACEQAGQQFLANVDETLASVRSSGNVSKSTAMQALREAGNSLVTSINIKPAQTSQISPSISSAIEVSNNDDASVSVSATFVTEGDRRLSVTLGITDSATYEILSWKTTTFWNNYNSTDTLWSGEITD